jgi:site-specific recombinase XerD
MLEGGIQLHQLSAYLGHRSLKPTLVYLHLTAISESKAREALQTLPLPPGQ